jgi:hypothetical protein
MGFTTLRYELGNDGIAHVVFDEPGSPVNTMKPAWQADMVALADRLQADVERVSGVIFLLPRPLFLQAQTSMACWLCVSKMRRKPLPRSNPSSMHFDVSKL